jgi:pimeloyl-ACP methyl ester carboxylesterase
LRGFGRNVAPDDQASIDNYARDVLALMDAIGLEKAIIGGHSMGGITTLNIYRLAPERFTGMILIDSVDLPGHGATPPLDGEVSIRTLADAVTEFVNANNLNGVDAVGSSMGARLRQAKRALALFPDARLHWFDRCGHFPQRDAPREATRLILAATNGFTVSDAGATQSGVRPAHSTRFDQSF